MAQQVEYLDYKGKSNKKSEVPITMLWKNERMIRAHSIHAAVREILAMSKTMDLVRVNIIGTPSTGKTELMRTIAHLCHKLAGIPYTVKFFTRKDLLNLERTISRFQPTNHICGFDDVSFLGAHAGKRHLDQVQKTFTEIRHLEGGKDVKIIQILNFHYNYAVPKYMRQSDFFIYTSIGSSELENTQTILGKRNTHKIETFRKIVLQAITTKKFQFRLDPKGKPFEYKFRLPFAPALFWNQSNARIVVFPKRTWIDPNCANCAQASIEPDTQKMEVEKFDDYVRSRFGIGIVRHGLRIHLFNLGVDTFPKRVKQFITFLKDYEEKGGDLNTEQLADYYKLRPNQTRFDNVHYMSKRKNLDKK